jgi:hypothetical protein
MKRQELLRQLDRDVEALKGCVKDISQRLEKFKEEERHPLCARVLDKKERINKGDMLITQSGINVGPVATNWTQTVEEWQRIDPNIFIIIRPAVK